MNREKALKILLVLLGLLFMAGVYPLVGSVRSSWQANKEDALPMMLSLYVTLGIFLLVAARNPSANRSVILFAAWSNYCLGLTWRENAHTLELVVVSSSSHLLRSSELSQFI